MVRFRLAKAFKDAIVPPKKKWPLIPLSRFSSNPQRTSLGTSRGLGCCCARQDGIASMSARTATGGIGPHSGAASLALHRLRSVEEKQGTALRNPPREGDKPRLNSARPR